MKDRRIMMKLKKILSAILAGATVLCTTALPAFAGNAETGSSEPATVAAIGNTKYTTLNEAFSKAEDGSTIVLTADTDITAANATVSGNKSVTLDLNGKTITAANTEAGNINVSYGAKLTLKDSVGNGMINSVTETYKRNFSDKVLIAVENATFVMESGYIKAVCTDAVNNGSYGVGGYNNSVCEINGGKIETGWYCVSTNGTCENTSITVNGGELISTTDYAIYAPAQKSTVKIKDGTVYGQAGGVSLNAGDLTVTGGTITSKGQGSTGNWGDGTGGQDNAAINVAAGYGDASATISGGKITANGNAITIEQGTTYKATVAVSGGTFNQPLEASWCADGYEPAANEDGTYTVKEKSAVKLFDQIAVLRGTEPWLFAGIDSLNYDKAGFKFTIGNDEFELPESVVCEEITCNGETVKAAQLGGSYIFGVKLDERFKAAFTAAPFADGQVGTATKFMKYVDDLPGDNGVDPSDWL